MIKRFDQLVKQRVSYLWVCGYFAICGLKAVKLTDLIFSAITIKHKAAIF